MAYNYEYPYTDPNRYNADWLLNEMKRVLSEIIATKKDFNDLKIYVDNYFKELNLPDEWKTTLEQYANLVNVKMYGAVGDGVADDTEAFQKSIDNNRIVFIGKGDYKITTLNYSNKDIFTFIIHPDARISQHEPASIEYVNGNELQFYTVDNRTNSYNIGFQKNAYASGGDGVSFNLRMIDNINNPNDNRYHWNIVAISNSGAGINSTGQNVAVYGQMNNSDDGFTWAGCFEQNERNMGGNPEQGKIGIEVTMAGSGNDDYGKRHGVSVDLHNNNVTDSPYRIHAAFRIAGALADTFLNTGFLLKDVSGDSIMELSNTNFNKGLDLRGIGTNKLAIILGLNNRIAFDDWTILERDGSLCLSLTDSDIVTFSNDGFTFHRLLNFPDTLTETEPETKDAVNKWLQIKIGGEVHYIPLYK